MDNFFYVITQPPFIEITCPVVNSSSISHFTHFAMSEGEPILPRGVSFFIIFISLLEYILFISVFIKPGAIEFTLILEGPNYLAKDFVNASIPALEIEYKDSQDEPTNPQTDEILIINPDLL